jgi:thiazole tautomerase (transcriptional regulator TenI)
VGLVSSRHRLCAAVRRPLDAATSLLLEQVDAAGDSGVEFFQVREPDLPGAALMALVRTLQEAAGGRVRIVVNERADVAAVAGVDLHLKAGSMPLARLRPWLPSGIWVSQAVHDAAEVMAADEAVDAFVAGTVRDTESKAAGTPRLGMAGLARIVAATARPVFAIGGLTAADWPQVAAAGAAGLAAIGWMLPRSGERAGDAVRRAMTELHDESAGAPERS